MGIRFLCPNGHKLNVKSFLAGKRAICPQCGAKVTVPNSPDSQATELPPSADGIVVNPSAGPAGLGSLTPQDTASPSVIIAVAESEAAAPPVAESRAVVEPVTPPALSRIPESVVIAPRPSMAVTEPVVTSPEAPYNMRRDRNRRNQMAIAIVLLVLVVVLAAVLIWVLRRATGQPAAVPAKTASVNERATSRFVAAAPKLFTNRARGAKLRI